VCVRLWAINSQFTRTLVSPSTDFRVNKYCSEYLSIGNEIWPEPQHDNHDDDDDSGEQLNEPVAEARVHHLDSFHQFTNLKIIKAEKVENDSQQAPSMPRGKSNSEMKILKVTERGEKPPRNKVYSQVIRVMALWQLIKVSWQSIRL
jgi:hypothetical protein